MGGGGSVFPSRAPPTNYFSDFPTGWPPAQRHRSPSTAAPVSQLRRRKERAPFLPATCALSRKRSEPMRNTRRSRRFTRPIRPPRADATARRLHRSHQAGGGRRPRSAPRLDQLFRAVEPLDQDAENRRFTRLTNAFSNKFQNHVHALALYFCFYNFVRIHKTLRVTPAMAAGVSKTLGTMERIAERIEAYKALSANRGPGGPRGQRGA